MHASYTGAAQNVKVSDGSADSSCRGTCVFTYDETTNPTITNTNGFIQDGTYSAGQTVQITGTFLTGMRVFVDNVELTVTPAGDAATGGSVLF